MFAVLKYAFDLTAYAHGPGKAKADVIFFFAYFFFFAVFWKFESIVCIAL